MTLQTNLFTEFQVHSKENSPESEAILNNNRKRLNNQCRVMYKALMRGEYITVKSAMDGIRSGHETVCIGDARARIRDLRKYGCAYSETLIDGRFKKWWYSEENIAYNLKNFGSEL